MLPTRGSSTSPEMFITRHPTLPVANFPFIPLPCTHLPRINCRHQTSWGCRHQTSWGRGRKNQRRAHRAAARRTAQQGGTGRRDGLPDNISIRASEQARPKTRPVYKTDNTKEETWDSKTEAWTSEIQDCHAHTISPTHPVCSTTISALCPTEKTPGKCGKRACSLTVPSTPTTPRLPSKLQESAFCSQQNVLP